MLYDYVVNVNSISCFKSLLHSNFVFIAFGPYSNLKFITFIYTCLCTFD